MAQFTKIYADAQNERLILVRVDETGAELPVTDVGKVNIALPDTEGSDTQMHEIKLREINVCVDGVTKSMIVLCSEPFDPT